MKQLTRYWFTFTKLSKPSPLNIGCGVTAWTYEDALEIMCERFGTEVNSRVAGHVEGIDVSTLDAGHVLPNMGVASNRGVRFPLG